MTSELRIRREIEVIELTMRRHLPVVFEDYHVLCLCIGDDNVPRTTEFEGPVSHRQHVAEHVLADLAAAGYRLVREGQE